MLRLQNIINPKDSLCLSSIGRRKILKSISCAQNMLARVHIENTNEKVMSTLSSRLLFRNSTWLKMSCVNGIHTQIIPRCQAGKSSHLNNANVKALLDEASEEIDTDSNIREPRKHHSKKQINHKMTAYHSENLKEFPLPVSSLHTIYSIVEAQLKIKQPHIFKYTEGAYKKWKCTLTVQWPENREFTATESSKKTASTAVALHCLHWLKETQQIKNGLPIVFDTNKIGNSIKAPTKIHVDTEMQSKIQELLQKYETSVKPIVLKADLPKFNDTKNIPNADGYLKNSWFSAPRNIINAPKINHKERDDELHSRLQYREPVGYELPINSYKNEILKKIENNQVILIKGDTGCGKTTQVPQFIMDSFALKSKASKCNIIVTQPRRISATSLAERIAAERGEKLGDVIGFKVKLQQNLPQTPGAILFCTTGILLNKMQTHPDLFGCSHLIIDEAHERKIDIDMLLALLKTVVQKNKDIKIIIMSATLNADHFKNYFNCATLEIPGRTFPVKMNFLEDMSEIVGQNWVNDVPEAKNYWQPVDYDRVAKIVQWISDNKPKGAILCFLPGWTEIVQVEKSLKEYNRRRTKQIILPIHSLMPHYDQQKIFEQPPPGVRKIILATDIAESGITVPDVVYVVDSATHKEIRWNKEMEMNTIQSYRISKANLLQRRGRAGRVRPGESFHFLTNSEYEQLEPYPIPEIKLVSLEKVALDCKVHSNERIEDFLSTFIDPPSPDVVHTSVENLIKLGALDKEENLTILGKKISAFNFAPKLGKTLIYSSIFNCVDPILTLVTLFSMNIEIFRNALQRKNEIRSVKQRFSSTSDHLALSWLYAQWEAFLNKDQNIAEKFADEAGLNNMRLFTVKKIRNQTSTQLSNALGKRQKVQEIPELQEYSQSDEIVKAVILSGVDSLIKNVGFEKRRNRIVRNDRAFHDENRKAVRTTPESVNHTRDQFPTPYFTYIRKTYSYERSKTIIRDTSAISPLTVLLFSQGHVFGYEYGREKDLSTPDMELPILRSKQILIKVSDKDNVALECNEDLASLLFNLRDSIWATVRYLVENERHLQPTEVDTVSNYRNEMLALLNELLVVADKPLHRKYSKSKDSDPSSEIDPFDITG